MCNMSKGHATSFVCGSSIVFQYAVVMLTCLCLHFLPLPIQYATGTDYGELYEYYDGETAKETDEYTEPEVNRKKHSLCVCHVVSCYTSSWVSLSRPLWLSLVSIICACFSLSDMNVKIFTLFVLFLG